MRWNSRSADFGYKGTVLDLMALWPFDHLLMMDVVQDLIPPFTVVYVDLAGCLSIKKQDI